MNRASTTHASHDELLIARLYGGDLDERARGRALAQVEGCEACAALLADLRAIAAATAALPSPPRPRDFSLTAADAVRLGRSRGSRFGLLALPRARALGGSLAAIGFAGMALLGTISMLAPTAVPGEMAYKAQDGDRGAAAGPSASTAVNALDGGSTAEGGCGWPGSPEPALVCPSPAASNPGEYTKNGQSTAPVQSAPLPGSTGSPAATASCCGGAAPTSPVGGGAGGGLDLRLIGLAGFAALAGLGLVLLLAAPRLSPSRAGPSR
jgi:hypothetical protein